MKKKFSFLLVLAVLVMGLSACGGSKSDTTSETKAPKATETAEATKKPATISRWPSMAVVHHEGLEPSTLGLRVPCSTN